MIITQPILLIFGKVGDCTCKDYLINFEVTGYVLS